MGTTLIKAECIDQVLRLTENPLIASGGVDEDVIEFSFGPLWDGFSKVAVMYRNERDVYHVQIADNRCTVPKEVLQSQGYFYVGVFGTKDGITRTSNVLSYRVEAGAITEGVKPPEPTPSIYESILASVKSAEQIAKSVRDDADAGRFDGAQGQKGDPGSDASVTAGNIQSALGYAPVKDVRVAGNSVLDGGVANVPMANKGVLGVSSVDNYSIGTTNAGALFLYNSQNGDIDARSSNIALTPYNLDYVVKAAMCDGKGAMCDGKGAAWTSIEQKAARDRMGVSGEFELIEEITLSENVMNVAREAFPDGTPYNLRSLIIVVDSTNVENRPTIDGWVRLNAKLPASEWTYIAPGKFVGTDALFSFFVYRVSSDGSVDSYFTSTVNATPTAFTSTRSYIPSNIIRFGMHINDFLLYSTSEAIPANTKISIYGVRV